jgi:hypothetical protein
VFGLVDGPKLLAIKYGMIEIGNCEFGSYDFGLGLEIVF